jgi:hypothetical protein
MGYTNYYRTPRVMDEAKFKTLAEELQVATGFMPGNHSSANDGEDPVILAGGDGTGEPEFNGELICFNGTEEGDMCHETFYLERVKEGNGPANELKFDFTKTNRKPYDIMVQVSMLRLKHHFPECEISSDGDTKDWKNGKSLYKKIFKTAAPKLDR